VDGSYRPLPVRRVQIPKPDGGVRELGIPTVTDRLRGAKFVSKPEPKYRDAHGNEWSGGRGRRPQWVIAVLEAGEDIENYRIAD
jgi:RNA-directed DNA polymerase